MNTEAVMSAPMRPRGRPPGSCKPPEEKLSETIHLRLTPREADAAYRLAIKHGESLNKVLRTILQRLIKP